MPVAAVPEYLGGNSRTASPGMRFGMYLSIWERDWEKARGLDWRHICRLESADKALAQHLLERQQTLVGEAGGDVFVLPAESTAPFSTGLGNEHPTENGFAFLWPYGLPYLPGSGVKGVLRQAVRELVSGQWSEEHDWNDEKIFSVKTGGQSIPLSMIDVLLGLESADAGKEHFRGVLSFLDVIPQIRGGSLMVEIMTAHQSHYYQGEEAPHDSGTPVPISFLTVPPGSDFRFHVLCDSVRLRSIAADLAENGKWKRPVRQAFEHAFAWLGFGAKTSVGYGVMVRDEKVDRELKEQEEQRLREQKRQRALDEATSGLPEDAAWIETRRQSRAWEDRSRFLDEAKQFIADRESLSQEARQRLEEEMEKKWPGIMSDPDKKQGKKQKYKFNETPRELAKALTKFGASS